jgi:hypothetical protein
MSRANHITGLFARLSQRDMRCPAYKALSPWARCAIIELDLHYWETGRLNPVTLTQRWLAGYLGVDPKTAARVLDELEGHWFLEPTRLGRTTGPHNMRGAEYRMVWLPTSDGAQATFDHRGWQPALPPYTGVSGPPTHHNAAAGDPESGHEGAKLRVVGSSAQELLARMKGKQERTAARFLTTPRRSANGGT